MSGNHQLTINVPLPSSELAQVCYGSLSVDTEPVRGGCSKTFIVEDNHLNVTFEATEARILRVSVGHFFELLSLVIETIEQFGGDKWLKKPRQAIQSPVDVSTASLS